MGTIRSVTVRSGRRLRRRLDVLTEVGMMHEAVEQDVVWVVLFLLVWAISIASAVAIVVHYVRSFQPTRPSRPTLLSPLDILERRYAAGEIDREDFDEARARLREHEIDP
jgi:putative membrane protein